LRQTDILFGVANHFSQAQHLSGEWLSSDKTNPVAANIFENETWTTMTVYI